MRFEVVYDEVSVPDLEPIGLYREPLALGLSVLVEHVSGVRDVLEGERVIEAPKAPEHTSRTAAKRRASEGLLGRTAGL